MSVHGWFFQGKENWNSGSGTIALIRKSTRPSALLLSWQQESLWLYFQKIEKYLPSRAPAVGRWGRFGQVAPLLCPLSRKTALSWLWAAITTSSACLPALLWVLLALALDWFLWVFKNLYTMELPAWVLYLPSTSYWVFC